jgi:hypothetical protein
MISEDVIGALNHFPVDLRLDVSKYIREAAWEEYVAGRYKETKKRDSSLLGGGKPVLVPGGTRPGARWRIDEEESTSPISAVASISEISGGANGIRGEFRRAASSRPTRETSADFGRAIAEEEEDAEHDTDPPQVLGHSVPVRAMVDCCPTVSVRQVRMRMMMTADGFLIQRLVLGIPLYPHDIRVFSAGHSAPMVSTFVRLIAVIFSL